MIHTSLLADGSPTSFSLCLLFLKKETSGIYDGFSTSPLLTTTYLTYVCGVKTT